MALGTCVLAPNARLRPEIIPNVPVNVNTPAEVPPPAAPAPTELGSAAHKTAGSSFERRMPAQRAKAREGFR